MPALVGGKVYLLAEGSWSNGIDGPSVGSLFGVNDDAGGDRSIDVTELWYEHVLGGGKVRLRIGKVEMIYHEASAEPAERAPTPTILGSSQKASSRAAVQSILLQQTSTKTTTAQLIRAQQRLAAVYSANQAFSSERHVGRLLSRILEQAFNLLPVSNGAILLRDQKTGKLVMEAERSKNPEQGRVAVSSTIVDRAAQRGEALITMDAAGDERFDGGMSIAQQNIASAMCAPLVYREEVLGVLYVDARGRTHAYQSDDLQLLVALAGPAGTAIKNAQYVGWLEQSYRDTLTALANAIELRDHYTVGHTWRVTNFAQRVASALGWSEERLAKVEMGGLLHDVGKIAVPDAILGKQGPLNEEEYEAMKIHPERGARLLRDISFLEPIVPFCLYHHERFDGRGYPFGLAGEKIPEEGRLIAVADAFDAMTSDRPYRRGMDPDEALRRIEQGSGSQFDPQYAAALVRCHREGELDQILQGGPEGGGVICPFCSTNIPMPNDLEADHTFDCLVCHRHLRLKREGSAAYAELVPGVG